jgi:Aminoglycoside-2''-adenylyltransferase
MFRRSLRKLCQNFNMIEPRYTAPGFEEVVKVAKLMHGFTSPWFIAGGWAIDLFIGNITREHKDIEIAIFRKDQKLLQDYLFDWEFNKVVNGVLEPWNKNEWLELGVHEIYACSKISEVSMLEILLDESVESEWRFRRNLNISRPLSKIGLFSDIGVPFLAPEIVLLYKAKNPRCKDEDDFNRIRGLISDEAKIWLKQAIAVCHSGHHWLRKFD